MESEELVNTEPANERPSDASSAPNKAGLGSQLRSVARKAKSAYDNVPQGWGQMRSDKRHDTAIKDRQREAVGSSESTKVSVETDNPVSDSLSSSVGDAE